VRHEPFRYLGARVMLSDGRVFDLVGKVSVSIGFSPSLYGDSVVMDCGPAKLELYMSSVDFKLYLPGQQAPEQPPQEYRALPSGAPAFPHEVVDGEILPED